ncbi:MAG: D-2-hydroxyacid dehydrogenase [Oscillospiraceae bacterium]|nr:D-2-hydroxyacid dehydrogenase [Oscillospiraceae bacterium]
MKIVVLDGKALAADDLNYNEFAKYGELTFYENTAPEQTIERIGSSDVVLTNKVVISREVMEACPSVRLIIVMATGYNVIDLDAARDHGITVTNIPAYSTDSVAQYVFACILNYCNRISEHAESVKKGDWIKSDTFSYRVAPLYELAGKTIGIVGFGAIGKAVAKIAKAFEMNVLIYSRTIYPQFESANLKFVDLYTLLENSDFVSLHCPLTASTRNLISLEQLKKMKNSAMLINSSRGPVVNESDLADALKSGTIAAAALDVLCYEPMSEDCPLKDAPNCVITPHIAWAPLETRQRLMSIAIKNLESYLNGTPQNTVNI